MMALNAVRMAGKFLLWVTVIDGDVEEIRRNVR